MREARATFRARGILFEGQDHGIARSICLRDLDGHEVELTTDEVGRRSGEASRW